MSEWAENLRAGLGERCPAYPACGCPDEAECSDFGADPAAAVPEAQDGREAVTYQGLTHTCNDPDCHVAGFVKTLGREQHHPKCYQSTHTAEQLVAAGLWATLCDCKVWRLFDADERPSAAVREGERERLAEAWDEGHKIGWSDAAKSYEEDCDFETANPYAPSLAAPEGTEQ